MLRLTTLVFALALGAAALGVGGCAIVPRYQREALAHPAMDATGMVALESARDRLREAGVFVVLAGLREQPRRVLAKAGWTGQTDQALLCDTLAEAAQAVRDYFEAHRIDAD